MRHPKEIGDESTLAIMYALRVCGFDVLVPFGENTRYDLVIDNGASLRRVQCKTGRYRAGAVCFNTCSSYAHHPNPRSLKRDYAGQIDDFAVYCAALGAVYLIPIEEMPTKRVGTLRVDPPRNNQHNRVRQAAMFELLRFEVI